MKFYGELLIFVLLLLTNGRVFFVKHTRRDPLVTLAPLCFILSIFQVISWRVDFITLFAILLSAIVLFTNFHAILRFISRLYVDHYSPIMKIWSVITMSLSIIGIVATIYFAPRELNSSKVGITETEIKYEGSFASGLIEANPLSKITGYIYEFSLVPNLTNRKDVVIFVPDKRADTQNYRPFLQLLSRSGFTVCSADFFTQDNRWIHSLSDSKYLRRITLVFKYFIDSQKFMSQREFYTYNTKQELDVLIPILQERYGPQCKYFLVSDVMGNTAISDYAASHPDLISGTFFIDSLPEYPTPGFGFVEQTDPLTALILGYKKDISFENPKQVSAKTSAAIKGVILKK